VTGFSVQDLTSLHSGVSQGWSLICLTEEETASELIWLLVEFTSSRDVELRALVSHWLLAGGCSQFLATWNLLLLQRKCVH